MEDIYQKFLATTGINTDSRTGVLGQMFVAIKGDNFNGDDFVEKVLEGGARYVITTRDDFKEDERVVCVSDTLETLQHLARCHRQKFSIPVIAIGGSNGKTTTKELVASVLSKKYRVLKTEGNLNTYLGASKTLLQMKSEHEIAIIEIGANHPGEHAILMKFVEPTHVLVTNNGLDHLDGFGSAEQVRKANAEIYDEAKAQKQASGVVAFVDSAQEDLMQDSEGLERILYSLSDAEVSYDTRFAELTYKNEKFTSKLAGSFNTINMLAAITVGEAFNVSLPDAQTALAEYKPNLMRSEILEYKGATWIVDCYNANPSSMKVAIDSFVEDSSMKQKGLILGGMRELGKYSDEEHQKLVHCAESTGAEIIVFVGSEFASCKIADSSKYFPDVQMAKEYIDGLTFDGFLILIKGSRGIKMETILGK